MAFKVVCINDGVIEFPSKFSVNDVCPVVKGIVYEVEDEFIDEEGDLVYKLIGNPQVKLKMRFAPLPEQRERINYVAVSETLRETAVEIAAIEANYWHSCGW